MLLPLSQLSAGSVMMVRTESAQLSILGPRRTNGAGRRKAGSKASVSVPTDAFGCLACVIRNGKPHDGVPRTTALQHFQKVVNLPRVDQMAPAIGVGESRFRDVVCAPRVCKDVGVVRLMRWFGSHDGCLSPNLRVSILVYQAWTREEATRRNSI